MSLCTSACELLVFCQSSMNRRRVTSIAVCCEILLSQEFSVRNFEASRERSASSRAPDVSDDPALRNAVHVSSKEVLSVTEGKHAGWFNERQQLLMEAIAVRNQAQLVFKCKPGEPKPHPEHEILQRSRKQLKLVVAAAKNSWTRDGRQNQRLGNKHPKTYWDCINNIKQGLNGHSRAPVSKQRFKTTMVNCALPQLKMPEQ
jgi:hypothetical protein